MNRLNEIRERLNAATPAPWFQGREGDRYENQTEVYSEREVSATSTDICIASEVSDASLIAHSPADLSCLTSAIEGVLAVIDGYKQSDFQMIDVGLMHREITAAIDSATQANPGEQHEH